MNVYKPTISNFKVVQISNCLRYEKSALTPNKLLKRSCVLPHRVSGASSRFYSMCAH